MTTAQYVRPRSVEEAAEVLADGRWQIFAGTTDVYPASVGRPINNPAVDLTGIDEIRGIELDGDQWRIGACTTWTDIASATLPDQFDGLQQAALQIGGIQIQNRGTVGGNLCTASPAGDSIPVLLSLSAKVELISGRGRRVVALDEFITDYRQTILAPDEFVSAVFVPSRPGPSDFQKLGARSHLVISIAMVSTHVEVTAAGLLPRIAVGACSPVARRLRTLEAALGADLDQRVITDDMFDELTPIDDVRGSAAYRSDVVGALVARSVAACKEKL